MAPPQSNGILPDHLMHKNRLQEYTQKSGLLHPIYQTVNEGFHHAPKFRSTVRVDGTPYTSKLTFLHRKDAEQDAAKLAFECITKKRKDEGCPLIHQHPIFCKSILHEFAVKSNTNIPTYKTTNVGEALVFVSSLLFEGKTYTGEIAGSKKMAEQFAARTTIQSLLGFDSRHEIIRQIIASKGKLNNSSSHEIDTVKNSNFIEKVLPTSVQPENSSQQLTSSRPSTANISNLSSRGKRKLEMENWEAKRMKSYED